MMAQLSDMYGLPVFMLPENDHDSPVLGYYRKILKFPFWFSVPINSIVGQFLQAES
ncbi:hypothetical protein [Methanoregula sp.]|jgi:hypothetical protein|uniref:hypothetical protein n=1 Tax=Methanoregula sp. TaxID=2052170 RepID=UPI00356A8922